MVEAEWAQIGPSDFWLAEGMESGGVRLYYVRRVCHCEGISTTLQIGLLRLTHDASFLGDVATTGGASPPCNALPGPQSCDSWLFSR